MNRSNIRLPITAALLLLAIAVAACGGGTAPTDDTAEPTDDAVQTPTAAPAGDGGGDGDVDLCALVTLEEISEITGVEVTDAQGANTGGVASCNWMTADGGPAAGTTWTRGNDAIDPDAMLDANAGAEGTEEISGIGERAVMTGDDNFPILLVLKGGALYSVSVLSGEAGAGNRDATIELARQTVDDLP